MDIKIPGASCATCLRLEMVVMQALTDFPVRASRMGKITTPRESERAMTIDSPGLVGGKELPKKAQIKEWIGEVSALPVL